MTCNQLYEAGLCPKNEDSTFWQKANERKSGQVYYAHKTNQIGDISDAFRTLIH